MTQTTATLHAGLLARKGEARPAAVARFDAVTHAQSGEQTTIVMDSAMRRQPLNEILMNSGVPSRVIELPRANVVRRKPSIVKKRKQIHARVSPEIHVLLKMSAARLDRTQQDLVASAIEAYLSFVGDDVLTFRCGGRNVGD